MVPAELFARVDFPDHKVLAKAKEFHSSLAKPSGSLGSLEDIGAFVAACQGTIPPRPLNNPKVVVFAGDHGVSSKGVSAFPSGVSVKVANTIAQGGAAVNVFARAANASVRLVDTSLDHEAWGDERVSRSCGSIDVEDAMTEDQVIRALEIGKRIADAEVDSGADILIPGDVGVGNTTTAAALVGSFTLAEPAVVIGRGSGIDDEAWKVKVSAIRDAMFRVRELRQDPIEIARKISSPDIAAMAGFIAQAAVRRTPVLLDGVVVAAAALLANKLAPGARRWFIAGHRSTEPAHAIALDALALKPILDFGISLGQGTGAVAALPTVKAAVELMNDMSTLVDAGIEVSQASAEYIPDSPGSPAE
ncbi:Nicotinate-nucleotide-dimethylbenzimidazolephosphoribosyltransferase [Corynebacterium deserti GIMN1.010]|uniref:Nicotinate-nucleotide--dimethylbenzimidazole phosphoribosyltransferase n=1 Tax=Corynebacterium deserti GIMN1.010 TaxID=931089 RepID=A0A0M5IPH4_9CORY|nr:nicotinate-nucleotide--dimethylbenzimidazole phosphoribosyltransferase [Corynebacterium deserti]ALC06381.1 Nicotinate-nucleotide-dimethylbenzimidazolephosphoribosyltransferase [Corynebacterium deserti GIMN1.010]